MKKTILAGLSVLALSIPALPALALQPSVGQKSSVSQSEQTANKQYADPNDNQEYQRAVEEMNQMFEKHKQAMMTEMNRQLDTMHEDMMRVLSERFKRSREQRLNQ
jgi:hypothetical protein